MQTQKFYIAFRYLFQEKETTATALFMTQIIKEIEVLYARLNWTPLSPITIIY